MDLWHNSFTQFLNYYMNPALQYNNNHIREKRKKLVHLASAKSCYMIKNSTEYKFFSQNHFPTLKMISSVLVMAVDIFHAPVPNSMENRKGLLKEAFCFVRK